MVVGEGGYRASLTVSQHICIFFPVQHNFEVNFLFLYHSYYFYVYVTTSQCELKILSVSVPQHNNFYNHLISA